MAISLIYSYLLSTYYVSTGFGLGGVCVSMSLPVLGTEFDGI